MLIALHRVLPDCVRSVSGNSLSERAHEVKSNLGFMRTVKVKAACDSLGLER